MNTIHLVFVEPSHNDLATLIKKLDTYLDERYPPEEVFKINFNQPKIQQITFIVAYCDDVAVGCGAISPVDEYITELKRFFVDPPYRRLGIALKILTALESKARELSYSAIKLETGNQQPEAIHFYIKHGYREIDRFGEYVGCESSLCYEKSL